jgi:hypothetical protein
MSFGRRIIAKPEQVVDHIPARSVEQVGLFGVFAVARCKDGDGLDLVSCWRRFAGGWENVTWDEVPPHVRAQAIPAVGVYWRRR